MRKIILIENNIVNQAINAIIKEYEITIINIDKILDKTFLSMNYSAIKTKIYSILDVIRPICIMNGLLFSRNEIKIKNHEIFYYLNQAINDYSLSRSIPIITLTSFEFLSSSESLITEDNLTYDIHFENIKNIENMFLKNPKCFLFRFCAIYSTFSSYGIITDIINQMYSEDNIITAQNLKVNIINTFDIAMIINKIMKLCIRKYFNLEDIKITFGLYNICSSEIFTIDDIFECIIYCFEKFYDRKVNKNLSLNKDKKTFILDGSKFEKTFSNIFLPKINNIILQNDIKRILQFQENIMKRKF